MPNNFDNIPAELKAIASWCVWRYEDIGAKKPTKVPYNVNGTLASVSNPETWSTFDAAIKVSSNYSGIGFIFSNNDPFSFVDLDSTEGDTVAQERQIKIFREFDSYSEISPSGTGLHIIVKGKVPSGRRRSFIEVYSSSRYATFTGNIYPFDRPKPIVDCQDKLTQLWEQMGGGPTTTAFRGVDVETITDENILYQAVNAVNGEKFKTLLDGNWSEIYPSQSEADLAFINIVAFYTQNRNQIARIFRASILGQRVKAQRNDYVEWMINKAFDKMLPQIDFDGFKNQLELKLAGNHSEPELPLLAASSNGKTTPFDGVNLGSIPNAASSPADGHRPVLPSGLLGEIAQFIYAAAPRPVPEIALAGAIGLMAGIVGRAYNILGTGLNQYILVLAKTGRGKESAASGIDKLMNAIKLQVPTSSKFRGPGIINSGSALVKHIHNTSNCFVSVLGEFGITIEKISNPNANPSDKALYANLLDLYNKSGHGQTFQPSIYSKKEDSVGMTESPAITILGESTPKLFYDALSEEMIAMGLLPRFLIIEYNGIRVDLNEGHYLIQPSMLLVERFSSLVANVEQLMHNRKILNIEISSDALKMLRDFEKYSTQKINAEQNDVIAELWNRGHMKALRLSGLVAVGVNMIAPVISVTDAKWAIDLVQHDIKALSSKFEEGLIGVNSLEGKQNADSIRMIKDFVTRDWNYIQKYCLGKTDQKLHHDKTVPYSYLSKRLSSVAAFRLDRIGATNALKRALQVLIDGDKIREIGKNDMITKYATTQRAFVVSDVNLLDN